MSKYTDQLNHRITGYLSDIHTFKAKVSDLETAVEDLKKEISHQKSLARKYRTEKTALKKELDTLRKSKNEK